MQKFAVQAIAVALFVAMGSANANVVPSAEEGVAQFVVRAGSYGHDPIGELLGMVRASADRPSASLDQSKLSADSNPFGMLAAGLAIMAVMARRRWRNQN